MSAVSGGGRRVVAVWTRLLTRSVSSLSRSRSACWSRASTSVSPTFLYGPTVPSRRTFAKGQPSRKLSCSPSSQRRVVGGAENGASKKPQPSKKTIDDLVEPQPVAPPRMTAVPLEGTEVDPNDRALILDEFVRRKMVRELAEEQGLSVKLFMQAFRSFRSYCLGPGPLEAALQVTFHDIHKNGHDVESLFVYFMSYAKKVFPHLEAMDELRMISDLTQPYNWYPEARATIRKFIFHAGPTNSGKTYHALQRFREAKSGVYCGPLKLLAAEVFKRTNDLGVKCDMVTGEERRYAVDNLHPSAHLSSTVEMLSTTMRVEVAVIDEIQMLRDDQRGWAWTRALLGVAADEVHLCGEAAAVDIVKALLEPIGETIEVREYERMSPLVMATTGLGSLKNVEPGDCIVCFNRKAILNISRSLEKDGIKSAVIYGDLPPGTKVAQAERFNNPEDPCNVLVSTDAIGMGLNLNIRRIIFHSVTRQGELIPTYSALQIAGRAGRYGTSYSDGVVMTLRNEDLGTLRDILSQPVSPIERVGIAPTFEQIETFSFHLPQASFIKLLDIFVSVCSITERFFICTVNEMKDHAELIQHIPLPLKVRYTFCISPLNIEHKLTSSAFVKMARRFSTGQCLTYDWMMDMLQWPPEPAVSLVELVNLEKMYEVLETYLWLSLRFPDMLPDEQEIRRASRELDAVIEESIEQIVALLENDVKLQGAVGSRMKKMAEKAKTETEKLEFEALEKEAALKLPDKRKGKRRTVLEEVMERGALSKEEVNALKEELREEALKDKEKKG